MKGLVYQEFLRSRKALIFGIIGAIAVASLFILTALSFRFGNLALLPKVAYEGFFNIISTVSLPLLAFISGITVQSASSADSEANLLQRMFRKSTPITPFKYAAAKFILMSCYLVLGLALAFGLSTAFCAALETPFTVENCATMFACVEIILLFSVLMTIFQVFMHASRDKVGLILLLVFLAPIMIVGLIMTLNNIELNLSFDDILRFFTTIFPFSPLIIAVILGGGLFLTTAAYKRREK
ncbi:MAG: hypothetical protein MSH49_00935 [[Eubacterium] saphenum]|nr:hypothetical protein [[Eubacterium] saphenum]